MDDTRGTFRGRAGSFGEIVAASSWHPVSGLAKHPQLPHLFKMTVMTPTPFPGRPDPHAKVAFDRHELNLILALYGRAVAAGEWRDYGMSFLKDVAIFSIFRRTAEHPIYRIEKRPKLRGRQGMYAVIGLDGQILKRGGDLRAVLGVLDRKLIRAIE